MTTTFVVSIDMAGNSIDNVNQLSSPNSVVTVSTLKTDLSTKANINHLHSAADIEDVSDIFQDITLDGGVL
jgi:hypothetical protein